MFDPFEYCGQAKRRQLRSHHFPAFPLVLLPLSCFVSQHMSTHHTQPPGSTNYSLWSLWMVLNLAFSISCRHEHTSKTRTQTMLSMYLSLLHLPVLWTSSILLWMLVPLPSETCQAHWRQLYKADAGLIFFFLLWLTYTLTILGSWTPCSIHFVVLWLACVLQVAPAVVSLDCTSGVLNVTLTIIQPSFISIGTMFPDNSH